MAHHLQQHQQQQSHPSFHQPQYVTVLGANDVLLGRGSGPNDHEGNIQFRQYVAERKQAYMATNHRLTKTKIAREIVDLVACAGGRFLKKLEETPEQEIYEIVSDETVMEKAKQALRQNAGKKDGIVAASSASGQPLKTTGSVSTNSTRTTSTLNSLPLGVLGDLEPIPFTDAGYSGPPPANAAAQGDLALWQLQQQQQQQVVANAAFQQQQQQQRRQQQQQSQLYDQQLQQQQSYEPFVSGGGTAGIAATQPYPYHQQQQRQMPPPLMRIPSVPTEQQQLYGYPTTSTTSTDFGSSDTKSLTPSIVSSEGSNSLGTSSQQPRISVNHRGSITIADLSSQRSTTPRTPVDDMTDSFSRLNASGNKMMASSDTMGTIDYQEASMADMSINSSTFSLFRGPDSSAAMDMPPGSSNTARNQFLLHSQQPHRNTISTPDGQQQHANNNSNNRDSGDSMSFSDLLEKGGKSSSLSCSIGGLMHDIRRQVESEMGATTSSPVRNSQIPPVAEPDDLEDPDDTMGTLRASSLDVVKALLPTESEAALDLQQQPEPEQTSSSQQQSSQQQRQAYYRQADPNRKTAGV